MPMKLMTSILARPCFRYGMPFSILSKSCVWLRMSVSLPSSVVCFEVRQDCRGAVAMRRSMRCMIFFPDVKPGFARFFML